MSGLYLTDMADVIRAAGVPVVEQDGWKSRARSSGGYSSGRPWCVMWHHTASSATATAKGDTDYMSFNADTKPIANIMMARDGAAWVLAAGATNTNGKGVARKFSKGTVPADSMNTYAIGMEIQNTGVGQAYSPACIDNCFKVSIALCRAYGLQPDDVDQHVDYSPGRKIDPATALAVQGPWQPLSINGSGSWDLNDLRAECRRRASTSPTPTPPRPEDFDVDSFIIVNNSTGQPAIVYGDGKVTGLDGETIGQWTARFGDLLPASAGVFDSFTKKQ